MNKDDITEYNLFFFNRQEAACSEGMAIHISAVMSERSFFHPLSAQNIINLHNFLPI